MELLPVLTDSHGRRMRKLRVSLTDVCNFRCTYCMPMNVRFQPSSTLLEPEVIIAMCEGLVEAGITEIRLTGGEPLARREFREIATGIAALPLQKLGLTTNGYWLAQHLDFLAGTPCRHINVSLDTLRPERFEAITRTPFFDRVLGAVLEARAIGFPVKVNAVLIRGTNDDEIEDFVAFSTEHDIPVRFLEYMKIGPQRGRFEEMFLSAGEVIDDLRLRHRLTPLDAAADATAFSFRTDGGAEIGFIASESRPFCHNCSRLRLSARGKLRACLMSEDGLSLVGVPPERYPEILAEVMAMKPYYRLPEIAQSMHEIGG
jgi:GTP 3',8-cyclase